MEGKKFEIKKTFKIIGVKGNKRFEINPPTSKKFEILAQQHHNNELWYQQSNQNDCGPCLMLNTAGVLGVDIPHKSIEEVRVAINQLRQNKDRAPKGGSDWLSTFDLNDYIEEYMGMRVFSETLKDGYTNFKELKSLLEEPYEMVYFTGGSHFTGVIPEGENYLLLDSFQNAPQIIDQERFDTIIESNIRESNDVRVNQVGIVRR